MNIQNLIHFSSEVQVEQSELDLFGDSDGEFRSDNYYILIKNNQEYHIFTPMSISSDPWSWKGYEICSDLHRSKF